MRETQVRSLGWEDPLEKEMATHSSTLAWKIPWKEELVACSPWGRKESDTSERLHFHFSLCQLRGVGWRGRGDGSSGGRGYIYELSSVQSLSCV